VPLHTGGQFTREQEFFLEGLELQGPTVDLAATIRSGVGLVQAKRRFFRTFAPDFADMGFFSSLLGIGKKIIGGFLGAPAAGTARVLARPAARAGLGRGARIARTGAGLVAGGAAFGLGESIFAGDGDGGQLAAQGGNGDSFRRTIVQTIRASDGVITRQEILRGGPHLMQHDLVIAKRVFRLAGKLHAKMPRRTVRVSRQKLLMQQVIENALEQKMCPPLPCPPRS